VRDNTFYETLHKIQQKSDLSYLISEYVAAEQRVKLEKDCLDKVSKDINVTLKGKFPYKIVASMKLYIITQDAGKLRIHESPVNEVHV
jgi:hypothetical protein